MGENLATSPKAALGNLSVGLGSLLWTTEQALQPLHNSVDSLAEVVMDSQLVLDYLQEG